MIDRSVVIAKLVELDKRVRRVTSVRKASAAEYVEDEPAAELTSFNLMLAVQCATDVATHVIADQEWAPAATNAETIATLTGLPCLGVLPHLPAPESAASRLDAAAFV